jgi:CRISPR-associated protein Cas1
MTLFERITSVEQLREGFARVEENQGTCGIDGVTIDEFSFDLDGSLSALSSDLRSHAYRPDALLKVTIPKPNGKLRNLAIPTVRDRTAHTAASLVLTPILECEFEDCSFAYRKERSVQKAVRRISDLREKGYCWVVDADISSFFDEVDHTLLLAALGQYVPDADVLALVALWLKADVLFHGRRERLTKGIPQGSPISPLLSNLYLDSFDEALLGAKQKLVRFADDFVILCKDKDDAEDALELTEDTLEKLRLCLNPDKTRITHFDHGFRYLGVQFLRSMIYKPSEEEDQTTEGCIPRSPPCNSLPNQAPLSCETPLPPDEDGPPETPGATHGEADDGNGDDGDDDIPPSEGHDPLIRTLYLMEPGTVLGKEDEHFKVIKKGEVIKEIPVFKVDQILLFGPIQITTQAMEFCLLRDIPVVLLSGAGRYYGTIESFRTMRVTAHKSQFEARADGQKLLAVSRAIISAKIGNAKVVIQRYARKRPHMSLDEYVQRINALLGQIPTADDISRLMGLEGAASVAYFAAMRTMVGKEWGFEKRQKQPPRDPVNSLLSYGYTLLFYNIYAIVRMHGLHPFVGFLHEVRDGHPALISDLMEEFRAPVVDTMVMNLLLRSMITRDDFTMMGEEKDGMCLLSGDARKVFIRAFENKMNSTVRHPATGFTVDYRRCIDLQVQALKRIVDGTDNEYRGFEIK